MRHTRSLARWLSSVITSSLIGLVALSCGGGGGGDTTGPPPPVAVATVEVAPGTNSLQVGETVQLSTSIKDASGNVLTGRTVSWGSSASNIVSVSATGLATARDTGTASIFATSGGKSGSATFTVRLAPVNALVLTPPTSTLLVAQTVQLSASITDSAGHTLTGRAIAWLSTTPGVATVSGTGLVTGVAVGTTNIIATSETKADTTAITVQTCSSTLNLAVGDVHTLTTAEKSSLCIASGGTASEYALVPFNNSLTAASSTPVHVAATNTIAVLAPLSSRQPPSGLLNLQLRASPSTSMEAQFRARERAELSPRLISLQRVRQSPQGPPSSYFTGISATPTVGTVVQLNANLTGSTCAAKVLHPARVVAVLPRTIVFADTLAPAGGYTDPEMLAFGQSFDTLGFALDTTNFGAPTDIDGNGRIGIFFTPGVNAIPGPPGGFVGGLQASRDLFAVSDCAGSNEGEMFYMPVPDPGSTINGNYTSKTTLSNIVLSTLVHEFQHLINAGRRIYVNDASSLEEVWLNEGLSHVAEELLYYRISGNSPKSNINLALIQSSQAQLDAANLYQVQNMLRLRNYMAAPEVNSPYSQVDALEMRGAIWELLRYSQDRKGGVEKTTWSALVNTTATGQTNFNAVFGSITTMAHDWSIAQVTDDAGLPVSANFTNPSWNFRSILPPLSSGSFPLLTRSLTSGTPVDVTVVGGGSSYVRFRIPASTTSVMTATSSGQPVPTSVDMTLVRTQ